MTAAGKLATENAVGRHFRRSQKCKSLHPFDPGTEALEAPWYHPDSARMALLQSEPFVWPVTWAMRNPLLWFHGFRLGGEFNRVTDWLAPPASSLKNVLVAD